MSWAEKGHRHQKQKTRSKTPTDTTRKHHMFKIDHNENVKLAQTLTYVCNWPRLSLYLQQEMVKVQCKSVCKKKHLLLVSSFSVCKYILLTSKKLCSDDILFLSDLVIYALEDSFFTGELHRGTRLTKPKETVPGRRLKSPSIPIVISSDFIHIISKLIGPVSKISSHSL